MELALRGLAKAVASLSTVCGLPAQRDALDAASVSVPAAAGPIPSFGLELLQLMAVRRRSSAAVRHRHAQGRPRVSADDAFRRTSLLAEPTLLLLHFAIRPMMGLAGLPELRARG